MVLGSAFLRTRWYPPTLSRGPHPRCMHNPMGSTPPSGPWSTALLHGGLHPGLPAGGGPRHPQGGREVRPAPLLSDNFEGLAIWVAVGLRVKGAATTTCISSGHLHTDPKSLVTISKPLPLSKITINFPRFFPRFTPQATKSLLEPLPNHGCDCRVLIRPDGAAICSGLSFPI